METVPTSTPVSAHEPPWFPARTDRDVAVTHVNVVSMETTDILPDQTVVLREGRILTVGPAAEVPVDGVETVDGSGKYLMPGLADMHVHYWDTGEFGMFLANGVTLVRNMWGSPFHLAMRKKVATGEFPGPRVVTTSPIIDGAGANGTTIWPGSALAADPAQATSLVREFSARGYQQTKAYSWLKLAVLRALGEASRQAGIRMVGHCPEGITYEQAIDAGMTCFEHLTGIVEGHLGGESLKGLRMGSIEAMRLVVDNVEMDSIRRLATMLAQREIWNCPTVVVWQGSALEETEAKSNPLLKYEPPALAAGWDPANDFRFKSTTANRSEWLEVARARIERYFEILSILHEEGAPLLLGTDTPNPFVYQGFSIHDELSNLVRAGLAPFEALKAGTSDAARFLGEEREWGTVAEGKRADLILLADNPLSDVSTARQPEAVFCNGYVFQRPELDRLLAEREATVRPGIAVDPPDLPAPTSRAAIRHGVWNESLAGIPGGSFRYRHERSGDGAWLITEVHSSQADSLRSSGGNATIRIELSSSLDLVTAVVENESFLGTDRYDVRVGDSGEYAIQAREIDGFESTRNLPGPLRPSEDLSLTAALLLIQHGPGEYRALGLSGDQPVEVLVEVSHDPDGSWRVRSAGSGTTVEQVFWLTPEGDLARMEQQTWRGLRVVLPA